MPDVFDQISSSPKGDIFDTLEPEQEGFIGGVVVPTLKAIPKVAVHTAASMAQMPISGLAAGAKLIKTGSLTEANKVLEENQQAINDTYLTTPEEQKASENINLVMKPFEWAAQGGAYVGRKADEGLQKLGLEQTYLEPVMASIAEAALMFGAPGIPKAVRDIKSSTAYRRMTIKERGLVDQMIDGVSADIASGALDAAQIRELWKNPANREALLKRYQGVGEAKGNVQQPGREPMRTSGADVQGELPPGQGFTFKDVDYGIPVGEPFTPDLPVVDTVGRTTRSYGIEGLPAPEQPLSLPPGQGFTLPKETPFLPVPSTAIRMPYDPARENLKATVKEILAEKINTARMERAQAPTADIFDTVEQTPAIDPKVISDLQTSIAGMEHHLSKNKRFKGAPIYKTWTDALEADRAKLAELTGEDVVKPAEEVEPLPTAETLPIKPDEVTAPPPIVQPGAFNQAIKPAKKQTTAENMVTEIANMGGIKFSPDYNTKWLKKDQDLKRVLNNTRGQSPDAIASALIAKGYPIESSDHMIELLKTGEGRKIYNPEKAEKLYNRDIARLENEWITKQLEAAEIDAARISESEGDLQRGVIDEIRAEGHYPPEKEAAALKEFENFFSTASKKTTPKGDFENAEIPGASYAETWDLTNPETQISPKLSEQVTPKNANLFVEVEADAAKRQEIKNSIAEGEMILKSGKKTNGEKYIPEALSAIQRSVDKAKARLGEERGSLGDLSESEIINSIIKTKDKISEAIPHLEALGRSVYESGKTKYFDWQRGMKAALGDLWERFKSKIMDVYKAVSKPFRNEKGAIGRDINKGKDVPDFDESGKADPVIKKREIKDKDGKKRYAPEIRQSEFDAIRDMPELRQKPLGGWLENPLRTFEELGENIKEIFYRPIKEGEHLSKLHFQKVHDQMMNIKKSLPGKSSERIGTYAIAKQEGGPEILINMGVKEIPKLTPEEMKAYNWMRRGLEVFYEKIQEARAAAGKEKFGHVEDYFTFARQMSLIEELGFSPIFSREKLLSNFMHRKTTPLRFEKHRVGGLTRADLDAFAIFDRYAESATRHIHLSPAIAKGREMMNTFKDAEGNNWILRDEKPGAAKFLMEWLDFVAGQKKPQLPSLIEKGLTKLNKNLAFSILSANIRSALIQPTAIVNTVAEIGPKYTWQGVKSILDDSGMQKSNVLFSRQFDANVTESLSGLPGKIGKARQTIGNAAMKPLQFLDMQTAKATWNGAYKKALAEGKGERQAVNYADDTVIRTQGSAMPSDLSPAQRTALGKSLTMFQTFVINQWGFLTRDVLGIKNAKINNKLMLKKVAGFVAGATLFNIIYEDILGISSPMPSPISAFTKALDEGDEIPSASLEAALEIAQLVPIVGGGLRYGSSMLGAPAEYIGDIGKKVSPNYKGPTRPTAELIGKGLGIPGTAQAAKTIKIINKGGSPVDAALGKYPKKEKSINYLRELEGLK